MNATQWAGMIAFGGAAIVCFWVRRSSWWVIGTVNLALAVECVLGLRHYIHNCVILLMGPLYADRVGLQIGLIIVTLGFLLGIIPLLLYRTRGFAPRHVKAAMGIAFALFAIESISLHAVDTFLYRPVAGLLVIGWLWIALGLVVAVAALRAIFRQGSLES